MSDLNELISKYWHAKEALRIAKENEVAARIELSDALCAGEATLKNKTITLSGGWKMTHEVQRTVKADKSSPDYSSLPTLLGPESFNRLAKEKKVIEFSLSGYNSLTAEQKAQIAGCIRVNESVAIKFDQQVDNR